jgi:hypothetical protein
VHNRTIQTNHQPEATIFQFIFLKFVYISTCFGRFPAHRQEINDCRGSLWFYLRIVVTVVLLFVVGPASREKELCLKLVICKDYIEMHGQENIKFKLFDTTLSP